MDVKRLKLFVVLLLGVLLLDFVLERFFNINVPVILSLILGVLMGIIGRVFLNEYKFNKTNGNLAMMSIAFLGCGFNLIVAVLEVIILI